MMEKGPDSVMRLRRRGEIRWIPENGRGWRWAPGAKAPFDSALFGTAKAVPSPEKADPESAAAEGLLVGCGSAWATGTQARVPTLLEAEFALETRVSALLMRRP